MGLRSEVLAKYRCMACGFEWEQRPSQVICPKCGHLYVRWTNYDDHDWLGDGNNGSVGKGRR